MVVALSRSDLSAGAHQDVDRFLREIGTSLTIIRGECHGLVRCGLASGARFDRVRIIDHQAERIAAALDGVQSVVCSRQSAEPPVKWCRLDHIAVCAVGRLSGVAQSRGVELTVRSLNACATFGQPEILDRVVEHLLIRAIAAARPSSGVDVRLRVDGGMAHLCITSRGTASIARSRDDDVGLQIVRSHIEQLGGTLDQTDVADRRVCRMAFPIGDV